MFLAAGPGDLEEIVAAGTVTPRISDAKLDAGPSETHPAQNCPVPASVCPKLADGNGPHGDSLVIIVFPLLFCNRSASLSVSNAGFPAEH
jgi:hypothetical protein